jgi:uncharacterized protein
MLSAMLLMSSLSFGGVSCEEDEGRVCLDRARLYRDGVGIPVDESSAMEFFEGACGVGLWEACFEYGAWLLDLAIPLRDPSRAAQLFMDACISGLGPACVAAGDLFILGDGVVRDASSAALWYELGCDFGDWESCYRAAIGYEIGSGVGEDLSAAVMFFKMSCEGEYGAACTRLGWMHIRGTAGEKKDKARAAELFHLGCDFGHGDGCYERGQDLLSLSKKERDPTEIENTFVAGCEGQSAASCLMAGQLLTDSDPERAVEFFQSGCELGDREACKFQSKLQKKL